MEGGTVSMAKDGTLRGNKPGNSAGAGRKKKPLADRIAEGRTNMTVLEFAEPVELVAGDVPPPKEYFRSPQKSGLGLCAEEIYDATYKWLHERGCENLVNPQQVETYSMTTARWIQCEEAISQYGFLSKHPTTQMPIASPFVAMAASFMKQSNAAWFGIQQLVKENCSVPYQGANPQDDVMESLLNMRKGG
jgi:hypothetical protein